MQHKRFQVARIIAGPIVVLAILLLVIGNLQAISDYWKLRNYAPPPTVATLADQTGMTDKARKLFYINHPQVADRSSFSGVCNNRGEHTIVLGCYHSVDRGIFLFDVTDSRLDGVEQVTAAHEMLHAAYDRLSDDERANIDGQLQNYYEHQVSDERIKSTIAAYEKSEPNDVVNEMHSIFATELITLPTELEQYYRQYFTNRIKVVTLANNYQREFTRRQEQIKDYDTRLAALKSTIDSNTGELKSREAEISAMQRQLNSYKNSGQIQQYNSMVPVFNGKVDQYNELVRSTQAAIVEYNNLVSERNAVALEIKGLTASISSQLEPIDE
jgi:hypothetical protein